MAEMRYTFDGGDVERLVEDVERLREIIDMLRTSLDALAKAAQLYTRDYAYRPKDALLDVRQHPRRAAWEESHRRDYTFSGWLLHDALLAAHIAMKETETCLTS